MKQYPKNHPNLLSQACPHLIKEWHPTKNGDLRPDQVTKGLSLKVWWQCQQGHEWQTAILTRSHGSQCPYCQGKRVWVGFNDLATTKPSVAKEWHPTKNAPLTPQHVTKNANRKVWWQCATCSHEWEAFIKNRAGKEPTYCPACYGRRNLKIVVGFNDLTTTHPQLAAEWHPTKNEELTPQQVSYGMGRSVWWQCACGCEWQARLLARHQGSGCPACRDRRRTQKTKKKF